MSLASLLKSISAEEMSDTFNTLADIQKEHGSPSAGAERQRVGEKFSTFKDFTLRPHTKEEMEDPEIYEPLFGFQLAVHWLGFLSERRLDTSLEVALQGVDGKELTQIMTEYQDQDLKVFMDYMDAHSEEYPFLTALVDGFASFHAYGMDRASSWLALFCVSLVTLAERNLAPTSFSELLKSITEEEMLVIYEVLDAAQREGGIAAIGGDRQRVAAKFPAFAHFMLIDHPAATTNPEIYEQAFGFQFGGHWLAALSECRADKSLENAFIALDASELEKISKEYQSQDSQNVVTYLHSHSEEYPFLPALFKGYGKFLDQGMAGSGVWLILLGVMLVTLAERDSVAPNVPHHLPRKAGAPDAEPK